MNKTWVNRKKNEETIIFINEIGIYKASPKSKLVDQFIKDISVNNIPKSMFKISFDLINEIRMEENSNFIEICFSSESYEHYRINDSSKKLEIFNFLKDKIPDSEIDFQEITKKQIGKKPTIGFIVLTVIFLFVLFLSIGIESGGTYEPWFRGRIGFFFVIARSIASFGTLKVILSYLTITSLIIFSYLRKVSNLPRIHYIKRKEIKDV